MLLGFVEALMHGRRAGPSGTPMETLFGWVLAGKTNAHPQDCHIASHHASLISGDDLLCKFWEIEENPKNDSPLSPEERSTSGTTTLALRMVNLSSLYQRNQLNTHYVQGINSEISMLLCRNILKWIMQKLFPRQTCKCRCHSVDCPL